VNANTVIDDLRTQGTSDGRLARAYTRIAGSGPRPGNAVRLLRDARENYPAWLDAISGARRIIHAEFFIIADDDTGREFADALIERARAGVEVRLLYDWLGCAGRAWPGFWTRLREAGVEVRVFNPPRLSAVSLVRRNHRKTLTIDGEVGYASGLCLSQQWKGGKGDPWRDTGVEIRGPAVRDLDHAFAETWAGSGEPLAAGWDDGHPLDRMGDTPVRVVPGRPGAVAAYRLDLLVAAAARRRLWLTDAYLAPTPAYVQALGEAARDGVDVRILVPGESDVPLLQPFVRTGYRRLIEVGVRLYEWNGTMLHAKTAVADGVWSRVGSTNLNIASWLTNWELDITVEDKEFASGMEEMFLEDLSRSTEIVLRPRRHLLASRRKGAAALPARFVTGAFGLGDTAKAAASGSRPLSRIERKSAGIVAGLLMALAAAVAYFPGLVIAPIVVLLAWIGLAIARRAWGRRRRAKRAPSPSEAPPGGS
jgi:cardiolipin synthase